jgi:hypothetical protein
MRSARVANPSRDSFFIGTDVAENRARLSSFLLLFIISSRNCNNLSRAGWSWGRVSALDSRGRAIWIADAHRDDGKRFVVHADEKLTAFLKLESAVRGGQRLAALRG